MKKKLSIILVLALLFLIFTNQAFAGVSLQDQDLKIGAWLGVQPSTTAINDYETLQKHSLDTVMLYVDWNTDFSSIQSNYIDSIYKNGSIAIITWEAWGLNHNNIINGKKDDYIIRMANSMKSYGKEIWISFMHEANGNWYDWSIGDSTVNTNDTYKSAYRHVVDLFRKQGASNVKFIYCVNCDNVGTNTSYLGHYPGDDYVDYLSIDGYNWGTTQSWGSVWKTFDEIFKTPYLTLSTINKPILITEFASTEVGGNKADWITAAFSKIRSSYPNIKLVSWFSMNKETDWRINSSQSALNAYIAAINGNQTSPSPTITPTTSPIPTTTPTITPTTSPSPTTTPTSTPDSSRCSILYAIQSSWGSGATINVTIKNNSAEAMNNWVLTWNYTGDQKITNLWNGTFSQTGNSVSVIPQNYNSSIPANGEVSFGFNISYSGTNAVPTNFIIE